MTIRTDSEPVDEPNSLAEVEAALRWLATRKDGELLRFFREAVKEPASESATVLRSLVAPTESLIGESAESRVFAVWGLIVDEIGSAGSSRHRYTLMAAFRVPPAPGGTVWKVTLSDRFRQLVLLPGIFGDPPPTTATPMHQAWRRALKALAARLSQKLVSLEEPDWRPYISIGRAAAEVLDERVAWRARPASKGAQPVFAERMLVTAVMRRRTVWRRITERDIVACEDGVDDYVVQARNGWTHTPEDLLVTALWACRVVGAYPGDRGVARLRFRRTLRKGERYAFVSEALDERLDEGHRWVDVDVDHHGIAPGGLTIQLTFDPDCLPEACWWYAEQLEFERRCQPPDGDPRLLPIEDGFVRHTFFDGCHPRESYGIAFKWSPS
ncbi:hypothetical protein [Amycolatopsis vastitatis]|uniref:Uncharacterized protein n=1 Tax=Amycolatopsis vastitatis TaxID=1905142 RepID=A0A229SU30_9PSEU|nr:hypothetical protein [Amycolatopsis vastitatis]OXM62191.1 hypothetical protein CF165_36215 [Amycolatopsis vastitatis]